MVVTLDEPVLESEWLDFYIVTERLSVYSLSYQKTAIETRPSCCDFKRTIYTHPSAPKILRVFGVNLARFLFSSSLRSKVSASTFTNPRLS